MNMLDAIIVVFMSTLGVVMSLVALYLVHERTDRLTHLIDASGRAVRAMQTTQAHHAQVLQALIKAHNEFVEEHAKEFVEERVVSLWQKRGYDDWMLDGTYEPTRAPDGRERVDYIIGHFVALREQGASIDSMEIPGNAPESYVN